MFHYGFDSYKVTYCTVDAVLPGQSTARPTIATGMVSVPHKSGPLSTVVFAGAGFIYIAPDYLGIGDSTVPRHRYFHAATEASSAVDLLAASCRVLPKLRVQQNDKLFTFGFSQGGHATRRLPCTAHCRMHVWR